MSIDGERHFLRLAAAFVRGRRRQGHPVDLPDDLQHAPLQALGAFVLGTARGNELRPILGWLVAAFLIVEVCRQCFRWDAMPGQWWFAAALGLADGIIVGVGKSIDLTAALVSMTPTIQFVTAGIDRLDEAIADYTEAIQLVPNDARVYSRRAIGYARKGELDEAIGDFTEAIGLDPKNALAYAGRGIVYRDNGDCEKAIADFSEAIRLKPKFAIAYCGRGCAYGDKGDLTKAIADQAEAIRLDPKLAAAYYNRSVAYERKGEQAKAKEDFDQAKKLGYKSK